MTTTGKTRRRELVHLDATDPQEFDRFMIALYRYQTEGKVAYRTMCGTHGGGYGTSNQTLLNVMKDKAQKDWTQANTGDPSQQLAGHNSQTTQSDSNPSPNPWPDPQPNTTQEQFDASNPNAFLAHVFCWHGQSPFLVWHRALTTYIENNLQNYDPLGAGHKGSNVLGLHYWDWDAWNGKQMPHFFMDKVYTVRSTAFGGNFAQGKQFPNPLYRWFAPAPTKDQLSETFPPAVADDNCTTRDPAWADSSKTHSYQWPWISIGDNWSSNIDAAIKLPVWTDFCTIGADGVSGGGSSSIENSHNDFHCYIGGQFGENLIGTMTSGQSLFDPIFLAHHSNIERFFVSWQAYWNQASRTSEVVPPADYAMKWVMYPWTNPTLLFSAADPLTTPSTPDTDGTFGQWWNVGWEGKLPYEYETLVVPAVSNPLVALAATLRGVALGDHRKVRITATIPFGPGGRFSLVNGTTTLGRITILNGFGTTCARCEVKETMTLIFEVTGQIDPTAPLPDTLAIVRHGRGEQTISAKFTAEYWMKGSGLQDSHIHEGNLRAARALAAVAGVGQAVTAAVLAHVHTPACFGKAHSFRHASAVIEVVGSTPDRDLAAATLEALRSRPLPVPAFVRVGSSGDGVEEPTAIKVNIVITRAHQLDAAGTPWAWTSHRKPGERHDAFATLPAVPSYYDDDVVYLYVSKDVPAAKLVEIVSHLLGHVQGLDHSAPGMKPFFA